MKQIIVKVGPIGQIKIEAVGYKGQSCKKATEALEKALGLVKSSEKKPEYWQAETTTQKIGIK